MNFSQRSYLLITLVVLEALCQTILIDIANPRSTSVVYILCGLSISYFGLKPEPNHPGKLDNANLLLWGFWSFLVLMTVHYCKDIFSNIPIDYRTADMLPMIGIMGERFLAGAVVYAPVMEIWDGTLPIYLPAMWMGFLPAEILGFDMRWVSVSGVLLGSLLVFYAVEKVTQNSLGILFPVVILFVGLISIDTQILSITEEGLVIGYYLLLGFTLARQKFWLFGIAAGLCLMSRYALAPWLCMYLIFLFFEGNKKSFYRAVSGVTITCVFLLTAGQAWSYLGRFIGLPGHYMESVLSQQDKYQSMIQGSLGLAKFFDYERLDFLYFLFIGFSIFTPFICFLLYRRFKSRIDSTLFGLCSLKLSLVLFYNLLVMPYIYLFYTSTFFSLIILHCALNRRDNLKSEILSSSS